MENDRTWPLKIRVYYGNIEHKNDDDDVLIRVRGDYSIGNLMALIGQQIGKCKKFFLKTFLSF